MQRGDPGILRQREHQSVLAPAGADHEDAQFAGHERRSYVPWILVLAVAAAVVGGIVGGFTDLHVYRYAGQAVLDGTQVYDADDPVTGLPFTYPPFAAIVMVPLAARARVAGGGAVDRRERGLRRGSGRGRAACGRTTRARMAGRGSSPPPRSRWSRCGRTWPSARSTRC